MMRSLYTGATGLVTHGWGMSSIANNLANTNTLGFKSAMMLYEDLTSQSQTAQSNNLTGMSQVGLGVDLLVNRTMFFQQGGFEQGSEPTDLAISGKGFFGVSKDGETLYTRAGNFRFTKTGELVDPNGYQLLGNKITNGVVSSAAEPLRLDLSANGQTYMAPKASSAITLIENLGSTESKSADASNPFFSLASAWNGASAQALDSSQYGYASPVTVYDSEGSEHTLTAYFDYVGNFNGKNVYQYLLGVEPSADASGAAGTSGAGLLAAGTLTFSSNGELVDMTMFQAPGNGDSSDFSAWKPAGFSESGDPAFNVTFMGKNGEALAGQSLSLNLGLDLKGAWSSEYASAADLSADPAGLYTGPARERQATASTAYPGSSVNILQKHDGYGEGSLSLLNVRSDGTMTGTYSNNQTRELFRIPLYRFVSEDGLQLEGGNHYSATRESGPAEAGFPGTENFGTLAEQNLEQSTVDTAREFASMIMTQRGFQMNSKVVTTSDQMLQKALELKR